MKKFLIVVLMGALLAGCSANQLSSLLQEPANNESSSSSGNKRLNTPQEVYKPEGYGFKGEQYFTVKHIFGISTGLELDLNPKEVKKCQTPQDKIEGCWEMTIYKPNETPYGGLSLDEIMESHKVDEKPFGSGEKRMTLDELAEMERQDCPNCKISKGIIEYENYIVKYFKNNQIEEAFYRKRVIIQKDWQISDSRGIYSGSKFGPNGRFDVGFRYSKHSAYGGTLEVVKFWLNSKGPKHRLSEIRGNSDEPDGIKCGRNDVDGVIRFYQGKRLKDWLDGIKECNTKADIKGTCKILRRDPSLLYLNGREYKNIDWWNGRHIGIDEEDVECINAIKKLIGVDLLKPPSDWLK
ncbi:hypothetical protein [Helicobacter sp. UBA3407]|uniref:hypothetical protein n=1 Tax=Helicobacter TaxID=209 RepID=UPI00262E5201|nr:hypothetical protein [Helicobacter sp. UBA3407]